ncbi:hypothetical protein HNP40_002219 [Mycobacteroides chelonae]|nr:hypothetical protein [Mycobacteroides chelonae]
MVPTEEPGGFGYAGAIDRHVDPAVSGMAGVDQIRGRALIVRGPDESDRRASARCDRADGVVNRIGMSAVDHHMGVAVGEELRDRAADTPAASRDNAIGHQCVTGQ